MRIPSLHGWLILAMMILSAWSPVSGRFEVEKNSISVTSPSSIKGMYDSAIGNFGVPQYGGSMVGIVVYPKKNTKACKPFSEFDISFKPARTGGLPSIVLVDRGDCFFALKVWNAQLAGAAAVIVADDKQEPLITMDSPEDDKGAQEYAQNVTIPSALVEKSFGDKLRKALDDGEMVNINLDWRESLPHPDDKVEYELWTNSNDQCGPKCDTQREFLRDFRGAAQILEKSGYAVFTPHYITWYCPHAFRSSKQCQSQCINHGRYCAPDPDEDFDHGYSGRDVVIENLRQLCVHRIATEMEQPWTWWDYVIDLQIRCGMKDKRYSKECAKELLNSLRLPVDKVKKCMGDSTADADNPILKQEQVAQVGHGSRSDVTILPTLMINNRQYRGKLEKTGVLKAICAGYQEGTEPEICLHEDMETNECLINNGGCWQDTSLNVTACKDTFRGRVCECPSTLTGLIFRGDGYSHCEPVGPTRCNANNGGCWAETRDGDYRTACKQTSIPINGVDTTDLEGCKCPAGFKGDGIHSCEDVDECKAKSVCQCKGCRCKNSWGSYDCECEGDLLYVREHDICISRHPVAKTGWATTFVVLFGLILVGVVGYMIYKYRIRSYMDSEIRAIMAQYMPLDNQNQNNVHVHIDEL